MKINNEKLMTVDRYIRSYSGNQYKLVDLMKIDWVKNIIIDLKLPTTKELVDTITDDLFSFNFNKMTQINCIRQAYIRLFGFSCLSKEAVEDVVKYIAGRKVLEVCAGSGWNSKILNDAGIDIIATDNFSWEESTHTHCSSTWGGEKFINVEKIDALKAIDKYTDREIVLMSWPAYSDPLGALVLRKCIYKNLTLIYIGEDCGGCTADDTFFDIIYKKELNMEPISNYYVPFDGIHDNIYSITKQ